MSLPMNSLTKDVWKQHSCPNLCTKRQRSPQNYKSARAFRSSSGIWRSDCHFGQQRFKRRLNLAQRREVTTSPGLSVSKSAITARWCLKSDRFHPGPSSRSNACPARKPLWSAAGPKLFGLHTSATVFNCFGWRKIISDRCFIPGCWFWSIVRITWHVVWSWRSSSVSVVSPKSL